MNDWPQYLVIGIYVAGILSAIALDGKPIDLNYSAGRKVATVALSAWVLWCGGFWEPILK